MGLLRAARSRGMAQTGKCTIHSTQTRASQTRPLSSSFFLFCPKASSAHLYNRRKVYNVVVFMLLGVLNGVNYMTMQS